MVDPRLSWQINSIYEYITLQLANEPAAYRLRGVIKDKFETISVMPESGAFLSTLIDDVATEFFDIQRMTANRYVIIYDYRKEIDLIFVSHIFHQTQDYGKIFQK